MSVVIFFLILKGGGGGIRNVVITFGTCLKYASSFLFSWFSHVDGHFFISCTMLVARNFQF
jgi:hypothetical protein